jgi:hypothetical protein
VHCEIEMTRGCEACSSPIRAILRRARAGVSFPSSPGTVSSLTPAIASGAPHSSTFMCEVSVQITACQRRQAARIDSTLAALPLNTKNALASSANSEATRAAMPAE